MKNEKPSVIKEIQELKKLLDDGTINKNEFEIAKKKVFGLEDKEHKGEKTLRELYSNNEQKGFQTLRSKKDKRLRILYVILPIFVLTSLFSFLLFGPLKISGISDMRDRILGMKDDTVEEISENKDSLKENDVVSEETEKDEVVSEETDNKLESKTTSVPKAKTTTPESKSEPAPSPVPEDPYAELSCPYDTVLLYAQEYCDNLQKSAESSDYADYWFDSYLSCDVSDTACQDRNLSSHEDWEEKAEDYYSEAEKYRNLMLGCNFDPKELPAIEDKCYK